MANVEKILYTAGNPLVYEPVTHECAYTELDRENSRLMVDRAKLRGELNETREALRRSIVQTRIAWGCWGIVVVASTLTIAMLLLR